MIAVFCLGVTVFTSMQQCMPESVDVTKMRRTSVEGGKGKVGCWMCMTYNDVELPFPDAKGADKLSIGGACYYSFPNEDLIVNGGVVGKAVGNHIKTMKTFVLSEVVSNIRRRVPDLCAVVLGKAFLWFIYLSAGTPDFISQDFGKRIKKELNEILTVLGVDVSVENFNPIRRVPVIVSGDQQGSLFINVIQVGEEAGDGGEGVAGGAEGGGRLTGGMNAHMMAMHLLSTQICGEVHDIRFFQPGCGSNLDADELWNCEHNHEEDWSFCHDACWTNACWVVAAVGGAAGGDANNMLAVVAGLQTLARTAAASLSPCPRTLYDLWTAFMFGLGERKPASQFTQVERAGRVKHKYFCRNTIWKMVQRLVRMGLMSDLGVDTMHICCVWSSEVSDIRL